ncbi:ROK family protein [Streptococcus minor]|uniref:ROK family protein n=1 Tax=Streptococcus minor TaxID=229549 RepID=A0A3P1VE85_9STRE|nr:ROK family protein [Streptococcus minor]RRD32532.1 ROK family protein [Streptococcus minor]
MELTRKQAEIRATILDQLYAKRPISRIDISKETHITPATTGSFINEFIRLNFVKELGELSNDRAGRKKLLLDIVPGQYYYLGLELSEKYLALVIADNVGEIQASRQIELSLEKEKPTDKFIIKLIKSFLDQYPDYPITGIGIGLPGYAKVQESPTIISKSSYWTDVNLHHIIQSFSVPVYLDNKSHCLTLAERLFSYHSDDSNFIVYHVARGIHYSYMYNGEIYSHKNFLIGEIGHTVINPQGERCSCGKHGCLQVYASEADLIHKATILYHSPLSLLKTLVEDESQITINTLLTAYQLGDLGAIQLIDTACHYLAISISNLCQLIDTERIYLDGELFSSSIITDNILNHLQEEIQLFPEQKQTEICIIPFSPINVARAAVSLCIYHDFLDKNNTNPITVV